MSAGQRSKGIAGEDVGFAVQEGGIGAHGGQFKRAGHNLDLKIAQIPKCDLLDRKPIAKADPDTPATCERFEVDDSEVSSGKDFFI
jgi:hypothetical protein